jgi:hypothetical protein
MKKLLIATLFLLLTGQLFAQETRVGNYGFKLGLTVSPNFGYGTIEGGKGNGVALGLSYGLIGDFNFAENYSFSTGLTITTINSKVSQVMPGLSYSSYYPSGGLNTEGDSKSMIQYIEIPLTIKLKTGNIEGVRWFGQFGLSNGIRISSKKDLELKDSSMGFNNLDWSENTNIYRAGMIIGGGGEFNLNGKTSLLLGLTLNNGFTNISSIDGEKLKNHYVGINLGVFF